MSTRLFLGRLLGLYLIAIALGMLVNRRRALEAIDEMARSGPWMLFSGMVATAAGLALVLAHDVWSGGALAFAVTVIGWVALLKGLALLLVPAERIAATYKGLGLTKFFKVWMTGVLAVGLWMTWQGFTG